MSATKTPMSPAEISINPSKCAKRKRRYLSTTFSRIDRTDGEDGLARR
jgi:hypothetical protein